MREIASLCQTESNLALAIEWLEAAASPGMAQEKGEEEEEGETGLQSELESSRLLHDKLWEEAGGPAEPSQRFFISRVLRDPANLTTGRVLRRMESGRSDIPSLQFSLLCRGETLPHTKTLSGLQQCRVSTEEDPYFLLGQFRISLADQFNF